MTQCIEKAKIDHVAEVALMRAENWGRLMMFLVSPPKPQLLFDYFRFYLETEPDSFFVCLVDDHVAGYFILTSYREGFFRRAFISGHIFKWAFNWILGKYGIGLRSLLKTLKRLLATPGLKRNSEDKECVYLASIATHPSFLRKGIASLMLKDAINQTLTNGYRKIQLDVGMENRVAQAFFRKTGFREVFRDTNFITMGWAGTTETALND